MSLIQDALKRKAEEAETRPPRDIPEPAAPSSIMTQPAQPKTHTVLLIVLAVLLLLILLAGTAVYLIGGSQSVPVEPAVPAALPQTPPPVAPVSMPAAPAAVPVPAETAVQPEPDPAEEPAAEPSVSDPEPVSIPTLDWPELELSGIASSGTHRIAIINGKMLSAGRTLGEVIVREVGKTEVVVEYRGERRTLFINE
jgi:hypothetical protein